MNIESKKIDQFTGAVDLGLECILALSQHSCTIHQVTIPGSNKICSPQENIGPVFPAGGTPCFTGSKRCINSLLNMTCITGMKMSQQVCRFMRRMYGYCFPRPDLFTTDIHRNICLPAF